ncbi:MAG: hypothetical protein IPP48_01730 [Chitinophagaceae bacterium]|nr:hypothetical protein [Chitinophagaceae bacterium]
MATTKIITNTIYYLGLLAAIVFDVSNFQFYFGIVFVVIQIIFIVTEYIITNRKIQNETMLVKTNSPFTLKDLFLIIPLIVALFVVPNLIFKIFTTKYLVTYISIGVLSAIIQYLIIRGKDTPSLLIEKNNLIVNDLFIKTYNLENLNRINFDGYNETYSAVFGNSKKIRIKQVDYRQEDLDKFIAIMTTKSNCDVILSENIKNEITAVNIDICKSGA